MYNVSPPLHVWRPITTWTCMWAESGRFTLIQPEEHVEAHTHTRDYLIHHTHHIKKMSKGNWQLTNLKSAETNETLKMKITSDSSCCSNISPETWIHEYRGSFTRGRNVNHISRVLWFSRHVTSQQETSIWWIWLHLEHKHIPGVNSFKVVFSPTEDLSSYKETKIFFRRICCKLRKKRK